MAARGIRDTRMGGGHLMGGGGRPLQVARPPSMGKPVMTQGHMVRPVQPRGLKGPQLPHISPVSAPSGMPSAVNTPQQVNPAGPMNVMPVTPGVSSV